MQEGLVALRSTYNRIMKKLINTLLLVGFLLVDFLFFHDIFKQGEVTTFPQYLTGILSIPVITISLQDLLQKNKNN